MAESSESFSTAIAKNGGEALVEATLSGKNEILSEVLSLGFNINSQLTMLYMIYRCYQEGRDKTVLGYILCKFWDWTSGSASLQHLMNHGAALRLHSVYETCFEPPEKTVQLQTVHFLDIRRFIEGNSLEINQISHEQWDRLLRRVGNFNSRDPKLFWTERRELYHVLQMRYPRHSARLDLLTTVILWRGKRMTIEALFAANADVNAISGQRDT